MYKNPFEDHSRYILFKFGLWYMFQEVELINIFSFIVTSLQERYEKSRYFVKLMYFYFKF